MSPARGIEHRRSAVRRGLMAETACVWLLRLKGYRVLARQYRVPVGEVDILARRGSIVAAIEVKARDHWDQAAEAVGRRQRRRIARATEQFLASRPDLAGCQIRFDVMLVVPRRWPRHLPGAWLLDQR
jgi:putative endonuclease